MKKLCLGCMEEYEDTEACCPHCGYEEGTPAREAYHIEPGTILKERYLIGRVLGFGGFGVTYIGYDTVLAHKVAVKEYLPSEFSTRMPGQQTVTVYTGEKEEQFLSGMEKFLDEARRLAQFQSEPGIIHIYDCFEENHTAYIVMEYLDGASLKDKLIEEGRMTPEEALPIILSVLGALKKVHEIGIIHRDIAPDNIYLTKAGEVKLLDFGAARYATSKHSRSLSVIIKPGYAPVEQYRSRGDQGPWTDVYAVGATFYRMITGSVPEDSMERSVKDHVKEPSKLGIHIKKSVETALMNALNVAVEGRTPSAAAFEEELLADEVKRIRVKGKKNDIGKWPIWVKAVLIVSSAAVGAFAVLMATGVISFDITRWTGKTVPEGKVRVPNVVNQEVEAADKLGQNAGLVIQVQDKEYSDTIPENRVLSQDLQAGSIVDKNETLNLVVSAGIEKTYVQDVTGFSSEEAQKKLMDSGLKVTSQEEENRAAPGSVASQSIEPDTQVDTGTEITLVVSTGTQGGDPSVKAALPEVTGMTYDSAAAQLIGDHVYLMKQEAVYSDEVLSGVIISQLPEAGTEVSQTSVVKVTVSLGRERVQIPDTQYKTLEEARQLLADQSLEADIQYETDETVPEGNVIRQSIPAGSRAEKGTTVTVFVSAQLQNQDDQADRPARETQPPSATAPPTYENTPTAPQETAAPQVETEPQTEAETRSQAKTPEADPELSQMIDDLKRIGY